MSSTRQHATPLFIRWTVDDVYFSSLTFIPSDPQRLLRMKFFDEASAKLLTKIQLAYYGLLSMSTYLRARRALTIIPCRRDR